MRSREPVPAVDSPKLAGTLLEGTAAFLLLAAAANFFASWFVAQERSIYFWDFTTYWTKYAAAVDLFRHDKILLAKKVVWSLRTDDYNNFAAIPLIPFGLLFGSGRTAFILAIVNTYALPAILLVFAAYLLFARRPPWAVSRTEIWLCALTLGFFAPFWSPVLWGYVDVGGVFLACAALLLYWRKPSAERSVTEMCALGLSLALIVLFRRWYAYWTVSFYTVAVAREVSSVLRSGRIRDGDSWRGVRNVVFSGLVSSAFFGVAAGPMVRKMITTDYAFLYSYERSDLGSSLLLLVNRLGGVHVLAFFVGVVLCLKNSAIRSRAIFCLSQILVILLLFIRTQDFDAHHVYLLLPAVLVVILTTVTKAFASGRPGRFRLGLALGYLLLSVLAFADVFMPGVPRLPIAFPLPHPPIIRHDLTEIRRLFTVLASETKEPSAKIYVLACSDILNSSLLKEAPLTLPVDRSTAERVLRTSDFDTRDGFPMELADAKYVIVGVPVQIGKPCVQRVVEIPATELIDGRGIGTGYSRLSEEFRLDGGVRAYIYERTSPVRRQDIARISREIQKPCP